MSQPTSTPVTFEAFFDEVKDITLKNLAQEISCPEVYVHLGENQRGIYMPLNNIPKPLMRPVVRAFIEKTQAQAYITVTESWVVLKEDNISGVATHDNPKRMLIVNIIGYHKDGRTKQYHVFMDLQRNVIADPPVVAEAGDSAYFVDMMIGNVFKSTPEEPAQHYGVGG